MENLPFQERFQFTNSIEMSKKLVAILALLIMSYHVFAGSKMKIYFNHPVDTSVATNVNAVYLNNCIADTLVAYINRAQYSLDFAVYNYVQGTYANIATAVNNAFSRGVHVRWIYDSSSSNTGLSAVNSLINRLGSPTSGTYGIMHNKFVVIDAYSPNPADAIVWTGSTNFTDNQIGTTDYNNVVIIQDSALAHAYTDEFNMMWGSSTLVPNLTLSKFGPHKTDIGRHNFTIDGHHVELYFSPSDGTNTKIQNTISTANTDMYFGMYAFTDNTDANMIVTKYFAGVYVAGIDDSYGNSYTPHTTFTSGLGASNFIVYSGSGLYHNKFLIVDPSDECSDPTVLTGSHNWSSSADTKNDEYTLIIHNDTTANIYYQSFKANFNFLGGTLTTIHGCPTGIANTANSLKRMLIYPNPSTGTSNIDYELLQSANVSITVINLMGKEVAGDVKSELQQIGKHRIAINGLSSGVYIVRCLIGTEQFSTKLVIE